MKNTYAVLYWSVSTTQEEGQYLLTFLEAQSPEVARQLAETILEAPNRTNTVVHVIPASYETVRVAYYHQDTGILISPSKP